MVDTDNRPQDHRVGPTGDYGTAGEDVTPFMLPTPTGTDTGKLTESIGFGRARARVLSEEFTDLHKRSVFADWDVKTASRGKSSPVDLLRELADLGFGWRDVARLVGVSVASVQKWRRGEGMTGESRRRLASLLAACDLISEHYEVGEVASWFEMPLTTGAPVTPMDLYAAGRHRLVFEYAGGHTEPEKVLSEFDPDWRERYRSEFEVYRSEDGELSIRPKGH